MADRHILFFCTGNTCRSPLVAALARSLCEHPHCHFFSAGLSADAESPASSLTRRQARALGLDLSAHCSRRLEERSLEGVAWAIGMTADHIRAFRERFPGYTGQLGKLGLPGVDLAAGADATSGEDVADPWHQGTAVAYAAMSEQVARLLPEWLAQFPECEE